MQSHCAAVGSERTSEPADTSPLEIRLAEGQRRGYHTTIPVFTLHSVTTTEPDSLARATVRTIIALARCAVAG